LLIPVELLLFLLAGFVSAAIPLYRSIIPLFLFSWVSLRMRRMNWHDAGLRRPHRLPRTIVLGLTLGLTLQLLGRYVILPILAQLFGNSSMDPRDFTAIQMNLPLFLVVLVGQWVLAGIGEEAVFRGYLLNRLMDLLGSRSLGRLVSVVASSLLFSIFHGLLGLPFFVLTLFLGCLYSVLYLWTGRNLWLSIITHATANSLAFALLYAGAH
jgi:membrane protease YdiL (CAAX protease family)